MTILVFAADIGLINLDNAAKFLFRLDHRGADFVAHAVRGFVGAEAQLRWIWSALIPFLLVVIRCTTLNQSRSGLFVFSKIVPAITENR